MKPIPPHILARLRRAAKPLERVLGRLPLADRRRHWSGNDWNEHPPQTDRPGLGVRRLPITKNYPVPLVVKRVHSVWNGRAQHEMSAREVIAHVRKAIQSYHGAFHARMKVNHVRLIQMPAESLSEKLLVMPLLHSPTMGEIENKDRPALEYLFGQFERAGLNHSQWIARYKELLEDARHIEVSTGRDGMGDVIFLGINDRGEKMFTLTMDYGNYSPKKK